MDGDHNTATVERAEIRVLVVAGAAHREQSATRVARVRGLEVVAFAEHWVAAAGCPARFGVQAVLLDPRGQGPDQALVISALATHPTLVLGAPGDGLAAQATAVRAGAAGLVPATAGPAELAAALQQNPPGRTSSASRPSRWGERRSAPGGGHRGRFC